ncbi:uncharacterized protein LOC110370573 isoform X1 [Helicoverpa armigera]|uniref:uncharacterized protein LOC110370573 isoform X1 n=1 Tax=Helicoverpa armigera TaxID=29058 RepID=UPI003082B54D
MLKLLGIVTVLYVCYHEIDAGTTAVSSVSCGNCSATNYTTNYTTVDKLEFWVPTTPARRFHRKRPVSSESNSRIRLRAKHIHEKSTEGIQSNEQEVEPRHDMESDSKRSAHKTNENKSHNKHDVKKHNNADTNKNLNSKKPESKEKKHKNHETEKNKLHKTEDSHTKSKKHKEEDHKNEKTKHDTEKKNKEKKADSKHSKNKQESDDVQVKHKSKAQIREDRTNSAKDDHRVGGPLRMKKHHREMKQGREPDRSHSHVRERKTNHKKDEHAHIRSTRLVPLSLMQQEDDPGAAGAGGDAGGAGGGGHRPPAQDHRPSLLSPYSVMSQLKQIFDEFPSANATFETVGRTAEYNDIVIIKISQTKRDSDTYFRAEESKYIDEVPEKKILFIVHGLVVMGIRNTPALVEVEKFTTLLGYYLKHLDKFDIFLIPMANPDGYSHSHASHPLYQASHGMWNKNMSPQEACPGVALDRNFDVAWNATRLVSSCSPLYPGPSPFSEVESKAIRDIFHYFGHKILAYIHVHASSYSGSVFKGDAILFPRGYTEQQSDDDKYIDLRGEIDEAMKNGSFQVMSVAVETLYNWYGKVTGSSVDYASTVYGIPFALEFAIQPYADSDRYMNNLALTRIWSRVIDTTFNFIHKSLHSNDVRRK